MRRLAPIVRDVVREKRARLVDELRHIENGEVAGVTAFELEMLRDKVRELDALLHEEPDPQSQPH